MRSPFMRLFKNLQIDRNLAERLKKCHETAHDVFSWLLLAASRTAIR